MDDHDQRFKTLLREFLPEFFELFFADWAARFDFAGTEWLEQEAFLDPPGGEKRILDLVAKVPTRVACPGPGRAAPRITRWSSSTSRSNRPIGQRTSGRECSGTTSFCAGDTRCLCSRSACSFASD